MTFPECEVRVVNRSPFAPSMQTLLVNDNEIPNVQSVTCEALAGRLTTVTIKLVASSFTDAPYRADPPSPVEEEAS